MNTAAMNSELVANPRIGNHPQKTMNQATHIIFTPIGKPFPKTDPLPFDFTTRLIDHPAFAVLADHAKAPPLVAPLIAAATTDETLPDLPELDPSSPEIAPFLLSARQQRATEGEPSLKEVGRDFNDLPTEVALLNACLADPGETLRQIADDINPEVFYSKRNRAIFLAVLYLKEQGQAVTSGAVLGHLKDTELDFGSDYISYFEQVCEVRYNPEHIAAYTARLQRAVRVRGGEGYCKYEFSEPFSAYMLLQRVPNMRFLGDDLHIYNSGVWGKEDRKMFGTQAMKCIHPRHQTAKRAQSVLDYVGMIRQVRKDTFHGAYKRVDDLIVINVNNGVLEVSPVGTVIFREHSKDDFFSLKLAADYDLDATCETFLSVLDDALPDKADRDVLQVFAGYILYPGCDYEASLVCYGPGGTGKSTILNGIGSTLGTALCGKASLEELCKTSGYSLPTIRDKMLNLGTELNGTEIEESANFKKLVSGEGMLARQIYCEPGEMVTACKLAFLTNNMPRFKYGTDAEARRLRILHFDRKPEKQDPGLKAKINAETSGILKWMTQGLVCLLQEGKVPHGGAAAKRVLDTFNRGNDPVGSFVGSECVFDPNAVVSKRELFGAFDSWCQKHGLASGEKMENFFWKTLRQRHTLANARLTSQSGNREHAIRGINLKIDPAAV